MRVFLLLITISISSTAVVEWTPNSRFNLANNFRDHRLPCSKQSVVFPETVEESIKIESEVAVREFVLPKNGELLFEDVTIAFGAGDDDNCTDSGTAYYTPRTEASWADPDVWGSSKFNEATPDAERVPCYDDEVIFPADSQFTISLPKLTQRVRKLTVSGISYDTYKFHLFAIYLRDRQKTQQFVLNDYYMTGVIIKEEGCTNPTGCPCQEKVLKTNCENKFCPKPKCLKPITPIGHCCTICGGYLVLNTGKGFDMLAFEENVAEIINYYGKANLVYHIGILPDDKVQLVVVDKGEYVGTSVDAVSDIEYKVNNRGLQSVAFISGVPTSRSGMGAKIAFSMLFVVICVMAAIYVYYYKTPKLPEFRYPVISRSSRGLLTRFSRRSESVVSLTSRRDSTATIGSGATAFRNPMYDSKRGRVHVAEPVEEEE